MPQTVISATHSYTITMMPDIMGPFSNSPNNKHAKQIAPLTLLIPQSYNVAFNK